jgi:hypothetical protein
VIEKLKWILYCFLVPVEYSMQDGEIYVREWWGKPKELIRHLKEDHGLCQAEINELFLQAAKILKEEEARERKGEK